jgi:hypothetical protein
MKTNLFIPKVVKVGFRKREDTFTGKLGYVIYYDEGGRLRKGVSWNSWRDESLGDVEVENVPMNGFILNKGVNRFSDWGGGRSVVRVYDPRDFEFEISLDNLIGILMYSDISKRDIIEGCVYAWSGSDLVLLPINSVEYQESVKYTGKQSNKVSAKDLVKGCRYNRKKSEDILVYIGFFEWFEKFEEWGEGVRKSEYNIGYRSRGRKHIFCGEGSREFVIPSISVLSSIVGEDVVEGYAGLVDDFFCSLHSQVIVGVGIDLGYWVDVQKNPDKYDSGIIRNRVPIMYRLDGDVLYRLVGSCCGESYVDKCTYYQYTYDIIGGDRGLVFRERKVENVSRSYYNSYYVGRVEVTGGIVREIIRVRDRLMGEVTYVDVMTEMGWGRLDLVLEGGQVVDGSDLMRGW